MIIKNERRRFLTLFKKEPVKYLFTSITALNRKLLSIFFIFLLTFLTTALLTPLNLPSKKKDSNTLPPKYKKWMEEEIVYIATSKEKEVFLKLGNDRERDLFIDAFWKARDPIPLTEKNEFKIEHYKRIGYANRQFGRMTALPGWKTDRGRLYISLGPPISKQYYDSLSSIFPTITWYYQGMSKFGLPDVFNMVFFKRHGSGDYQLYSPNMDGPESLVANYSVGQSEGYSREAALQEIYSVDPSLALVSISLLPGETYSLSSERLLYDINYAPQKTVKDEYAEKLLMYKDIVEVEYSANYIENESSLNVIQDKSGIFFVHYLIELNKFSVNLYDERYITRLIVNGKISDMTGKTIFQYKRTLPVEFNHEQFTKIKAQKYCLQDMFPLAEGDYQLNVLVKNEASKEFTSIEKNISIPKSSSLQIGDLILAYKGENDTLYNKSKAFKVRDLQLYCSPRNDFTSSDKIILFSQIYGLNRELKEDGFLKISIYKDGEEFKSLDRELNKYKSSDFILEEFSLMDFPLAYYKMRISLFNKNKEEIIKKENNFYVSYVASLPRPWISFVLHPSSDDPSYSSIIGVQLFNKGEYEKAKNFSEKAYRRNPNSLQFAMNYSAVLFPLKDFPSVIEILTPFLMRENFEVLEPMARSYYLSGQFDKAILHFKNYISHYGANFYILNLLGESYYQLGKKEEALKAWEKSLEMNPNQEELKEILNSIKKEK